MYALLISFTLLLACQQKTIKGTDFYQLNGKVKEIKEKSYEAINNLGTWLRNPADTLNTYRLFLFDEDGNTHKEQYYSIHSKRIEDKTIYEYKDKIVHRILAMHEGKIIKTEYVLKAEPNFKILQLYSGKDTTTIEWRGNRPVKTINSNGKIGIAEYDKNGNCIKQTQVDEKGDAYEVTLFEYFSFDRKGNWTKRVMYRKENPQDHPFIEEREISYY